MSTTAENEKSFPHYSLLPLELQRMLIGEMQPDDRCRFTRCSKFSYIEVNSSQSYIHELKFCTYSENRYRIHIVHCVDNNMREQNGFILEFQHTSENKLAKKMNLKERTLFEEKLEDSTDLLKYATEHFKAALRFYHKFVKKLVISGNICKEIDLGIKNLSSLEELEVYSDINIQQFLSKTSKTLKLLGARGVEDNEYLAECEQIYKVEERLYLPDTVLTIEQLKKLSAKEITTNIGSMNIFDIYIFLLAWQNEGFENLQHYECCFNDKSNLDIQLLLNVVGMTNIAPDSKHITIGTRSSATRHASLHNFEISATGCKIWKQAIEIFF